jgi:translation initiation factor 4A
MGAKVHFCIGGLAVGKDIAALRNNVHIVVGTPGRIIDLIRRGNLSTSSLKIMILDEADEMLSSGFLEAVQEIMREIPSACQIGLFSATLPPETLEITEHFMKDPIRLILNRELLTLEGISQYFVDVGEEANKLDTIVDLFDSVSVSQCIIFCNSRRKTDWLTAQMSQRDFPVACIHSELSSAERTDIMEAFSRGSSRVLIATDLIARGIDVQGVQFVINYDMTRNFENYIHRIGRGGRFGRKGVAINFVTSQEGYLMRQLCAFYNTAIEPLPQNFTLPA